MIILINIVEIFIIIIGIKYVVDMGMVKVKKYNFDSGFEVLVV